MSFIQANVVQVDGVQGIMMAYMSALLNVSLAGPTLFGPVISNAALIASQSLANSWRKYFVLLIITVRLRTCDVTILFNFARLHASLLYMLYCSVGCQLVFEHAGSVTNRKNYLSH